VTLERLWAGWRGEYVSGATASSTEPGCVFCHILDSGEPDETTHVLWRGERTFAVLNAYPYTSGHLMVMPLRHVAELHELADDEADELFGVVRHASKAIGDAYQPEGLNVGANLGRAAGAGVPGHLHLHVLPRWAGDTNFMTSIAEARVLPESLGDSWRKLKAAW
jgi:diadenosine tetraphosphate (Ap4A) HIT family hydrolase